MQAEGEFFITMRILYDKEIPKLDDFFLGLGIEALPFAHREFSKKLLDDYAPQALFIRSTTNITPELLSGTNIEFIATATSGTDHIDPSILNSSSITCASAKGSNANAVAEYCISGILEYAHQKSHDLSTLTLGIIGYGNVGQRLALYASLLGLHILVHDPPRQKMNLPFYHTQTEFPSLLESSDIISFHVPLEKSGHHSTFHYLNKRTIELLHSHQLLINAARGGIIDEQALLHSQKRPTLIFDTWEHEPNISLLLARQCFIATPHAAGYTRNAKDNASDAIIHAWLSYTGQKDTTLKVKRYDITFDTHPRQAQTSTIELCKNQNELRQRLADTRKLLLRSELFVQSHHHSDYSEVQYFDKHRASFRQDQEILSHD